MCKSHLFSISSTREAIMLVPVLENEIREEDRWLLVMLALYSNRYADRLDIVILENETKDVFLLLSGLWFCINFKESAYPSES